MIKARYLLLWLVVTTALSMWLSVLIQFSSATTDPDAPWHDASFISLLYVSLFAVTGVHARWAGIRLDQTFGRWPGSREALRFALWGIPVIAMAVVCVYAVFVPLSFAWPNAVQSWLFEQLPVLYDTGPPYPLVENLIACLFAAVAGPIVEEWVFRGLLLRRWSRKWGTVRGVVLSSAVFAIMHADLVGAFLFGVLMCGLYARYQSLWPSAIVHMSNNTLAVLGTILEAHGLIGETRSVEDLRDTWGVPIVGLLIAAPWAWHVLRSWERISTWHFGYQPTQDVLAFIPAEVTGVEDCEH